MQAEAKVAAGPNPYRSAHETMWIVEPASWLVVAMAVAAVAALTIAWRAWRTDGATCAGPDVAMKRLIILSIAILSLGSLATLIQSTRILKIAAMNELPFSLTAMFLVDALWPLGGAFGIVLLNCVLALAISLRRDGRR